MLEATDTDNNSDLDYSITGINCYDEKNLPNNNCDDWFEITSERTSGTEKVGSEYLRKFV